MVDEMFPNIGNSFEIPESIILTPKNEVTNSESD